MMRFYYAVTHVASQLIYRWLPPPVDLAGSADEDPLRAGIPGDAPEHLSEIDVQDLLRWELERAVTRLPWLAAYCLRHDPGGCRLAAAFVAYYARMRQLGAHWLCPLDAAYPPLLALIADPPLGLGVLGEVSVLTRPLVSIVGSRKASAHAVRQSYDLGRRLAAAGVSVVSGGAFGCDVAAHHGVLAQGGTPAGAVCVFAGGLSQLYPRGNDFVFRRLQERQGVLLSERLWEASCRARDFHVRNRLIAGMAGLTVVMQAAKASGTLLTARLAADQGRDLAVLIHPGEDVRADGSAELIADGAYGFADADVLLHRLGLRPSHPLDGKTSLDPKNLQ